MKYRKHINFKENRREVLEMPSYYAYVRDDERNDGWKYDKRQFIVKQLKEQTYE